MILESLFKFLGYRLPIDLSATLLHRCKSPSWEKAQNWHAVHKKRCTICLTSCITGEVSARLRLAAKACIKGDKMQPTEAQRGWKARDGRITNKKRDRERDAGMEYPCEASCRAPRSTKTAASALATGTCWLSIHH